MKEIELFFAGFTKAKETGDAKFLKKNGWKKSPNCSPFSSYWIDPTDGVEKKTSWAVVLQHSRPCKK